MDLREGDRQWAIFMVDSGVGFGGAFYEFAEIAVGLVHILKLLDEALPVGSSGAHCWMFYVDQRRMLRRSRL
jgi:hypothetical protein